jgi:hypothetical protein
VTESEIEYEMEVHRPGIEFEINRELDRDERRVIDRRAEWYAQQRRERGWA